MTHRGYRAASHSAKRGGSQIALVYASGDRAWAEWIAGVLEEARVSVLPVLFDGDELPPPTYWKNMAHRRTGFFRVFLLVSRHLCRLYGTARWVELWRKAIYRHAVGLVRSVYVEPLPLGESPGANVPLLPRIELYGRSREAARLALLEGLLGIDPLLIRSAFPGFDGVHKQSGGATGEPGRVVHATIEINLPASRVGEALSCINQYLQVGLTSFSETLDSGRFQVTAGNTIAWRETGMLRDLLELYVEMAKAAADGSVIGARAEVRAKISLLLNLLSLSQWETRLLEAIDDYHQQYAVAGRQKDHEAISRWLEGADPVERLVEALQENARGGVASGHDTEPD